MTCAWLTTIVFLLAACTGSDYLLAHASRSSPILMPAWVRGLASSVEAGTARICPND